MFWKYVNRFATAYQTGTHYFVLLIITDGVITDMPQTKEAIVQVKEMQVFIRMCIIDYKAIHYGTIKLKVCGLKTFGNFLSVKDE